MVAMLTVVTSASAQKIIIGERAPEIKVSEWLNGAPADSKAYMIEFYHSSSKQADQHLATLDAVAEKYAGKLNVIVVAKESKDKISSTELGKQHKFHTAIDDNGKTFDNHGVQFVPFSVIVDSKGRAVWFGNPTSLSVDDIAKYIK